MSYCHAKANLYMYLSFVYTCITLGILVIKRRGTDPINQFNPASYVYLSQVRIVISNVLCRVWFHFILC